MTHLIGRGNRSAALVSLALAVGCSGDGCGCVSPIPGGFPAEDRVERAAQVRVTPTAFDTLAADPAGLVGGLLGSQNGEAVEFEIPPSCGDDPRICCPDDMPVSPCGPLEIDLSEQQGDAPRLEINPIEGQSTIELIVRTRVRTLSSIPVEQSGVGCDIDIDTTADGAESVVIAADLVFTQDAEAGTTRVEVENPNVDPIDNGDLDISGNFFCEEILDADFVKGEVIDLLKGELESMLSELVADELCKPCPSGDVAECGQFADACEDETCMKGEQCLQELGLAGRMFAQDVLGSFSVGQLGAIDLYEVAGGYADTDGGGVSLGLLGGMLPAGSERDRCGPASTGPAAVSVPKSAVFEGDEHPKTGAPFDVGIGLHEHNLDLFAWSAYESGFLCLNVGTRAVDVLTTDTLSVLFPSIVDLTHGQNAQVVLGLRPQRPPEIALGEGTTAMEDGEIVIEDPLLDITFTDLDLDFFAMVDDQFIRVMTLTADVHLPLNLEVNEDGDLEPVLGDIDDAFTNIRVSNAEALLESPSELEDTFPALINLALPLLGDALGGFALPELAGLQLDVPPQGVTSVDGQTFLAIFANLGVAASSPRVVTEARLAAAYEPQDFAQTAARLTAPGPQVELELGGRSERGAPLEWAYRVDGGLWSPYTRARRVRIDRPVLALPGEHEIQVRAREVGRPRTTDRSPARVLLATPPPPRDERGRPVVGFHGHGAPAGCECGVAGADPRSLVGGFLCLCLASLGLRRRSGTARRRARLLRGTALALLLLGAGLLSACDCGGNKVKCEGGQCLEGEVERGPIGRWNDVAAEDGRIVASAYDQGLGDLVLVEVEEGGELSHRAVDGVPDVAPTYEPSTYRGGVEQPGPDVGAWTSVALAGGRARIAYQDRERGVLKFATEREDGTFQTHVVDDETAGGELGLYSALALDPGGIPQIAYMAIGVDDPDGGGAKLSQLRYASASGGSPAKTSDWTVTVVEEAAISCAGLCAEGTACVAEGAGERCAATEATCGDGCGDSEACVGGACVEAVPDPTARRLPEGVGLFLDHLFLPDGRAIVVYYDRDLADLVLQERGGSSFTRHELDADADTDTGMWASAAADAEGTVHLTYQDAVGDRLLYTTWADGQVGPIEVVDDGTREGEDKTHPVGASSAVFVDRAGIGVAYQDGLTSNLIVARRSGDGSWTRSDLLAGPVLYGFHVHATTADGGAVISSYFYDREFFPPGELSILRVPQP